MNKELRDKKFNKMSITEYAKLIGVSKPAISYRMKRNKELPGVERKEYSTIDMKYYFYVEVGLTKKQAQKYFQNLENYQKRKIA